MVKYLSPAKIAEKWGDVKARQVTLYCELGRIPGAYKVSNNWIIPADAEKPADARIKSGKYIGSGNYQKYIKPKRNKKK